LLWKDRPLAIAFWSINIGLAAMVLLSTLPIGLAQAWASVEIGTWYARSSEFLHTPTLTWLRWMRMFGDTIFAFGAIVLDGLFSDWLRATPWIGEREFLKKENTLRTSLNSYIRASEGGSHRRH
jgi:nitric oxide reductase subunit B